MNDKDVIVDIDDIPPPEGEEGPFYLITSTAYSQDTDSSTTVESYVSLTSSLPEFFGNAITSRQTVTIQPDSVVNGNVQLPSEEGLTLRERAVITGDVIYAQVANWPDVEDLSDFYWQDVRDSGSFPDSSIDIAGSDIVIGPLYRDGDLEIFNTGGPATVTLNGTVYVTGQLKVGKTVYDFTLDLNGQTIYSEYYHEGGVTAIDIGGKCTATGSGWIVAAGDIFFLPKVESNPGDFVFIISVLGHLKFQPEGVFNGSVAGNTDVRLQPKYPFNCEGNPGGGNFPPVFWAQISTYNIYN